MTHDPPAVPRPLVHAELTVVDELAPLRRSVREALRSAGSGDHLDDLVLGMHEVVVNALVHGGAPVTVRLSAPAGGFVCEISDTGTGPTAPPGPSTMPPPERTVGRGAALRSLAWRSTHHRSPTGTTVVLRATRP